MAEDMMRACAIIVAGGSGTRFGNPGGKLLIEVAGKPLITWTLEAFDAAERVSRIVVVCPPDKSDEMQRRAVEPYSFSTPIAFAPLAPSGRIQPATACLQFRPTARSRSCTTPPVR